MKHIGIIVPCYNEEEALPLFFEEVQKHLPATYQFTFFIIDDGSKDKTLTVIKQLKSNHPIEYTSFSRNFGKESAMLAGLRFAKHKQCDATIIIDADLQHPPTLIPVMLESYEAGYKHIYARQRKRKGAPILKTIAAWFFYRVYAFFTGFKDMSQGAVDFCLIDRDVIDAFLSLEDTTRFTKGIFSWVGFEKKCIDFDLPMRVAGQTKWSLIQLYRYAFVGIKQFSQLYIWIPSFLIIATLGILTFDILFGLITVSLDWLSIRLDVFLLMILIAFRYVMKLLYDIRNQGLHRPHYLIKETTMHHD